MSISSLPYGNPLILVGAGGACLEQVQLEAAVPMAALRQLQDTGTIDLQGNLKVILFQNDSSPALSALEKGSF